MSGTTGLQAMHGNILMAPESNQCSILAHACADHETGRAKAFDALPLTLRHNDSTVPTSREGYRVPDVTFTRGMGTLVDKSVSVIDQAVRAISKTIARALQSPTSLLQLTQAWSSRSSGSPGASQGSFAYVGFLERHECSSA